TKITGFQLAAGASSTAALVTPPAGGSCTVTRTSPQQGQVTTIPVQLSLLDAGAITFSGPGITNLALTQDAKNTYSLALGTEGLPVPIPGAPNVTLTAGQYTLAGAGGKDV